MPDIDSSISTETNVAPITSEISVPDLPSSGGLTGLDTSNGRKPTEAEIIASFNTPNKVETKPEVKIETSVVNNEVKEPTQEELEAQTLKENEEAEQAEALVPEEDISVAKINQYAREIPELKQAFDKNPSLRNSLFAMARRSSKLSEYQTIMPSPEAAKFAAQNSEQMVQFNDSFFSEDPSDNIQFWSALHQNSLLKDPVTGDLVLDPKTQQPISTGAYERVTGAYRQALYSDIASLAGKITDPEQSQKVKDALAVIGEITGDFKPLAKEQITQLPKDVQDRLNKADQIEQQLKQSQTQQASEFEKTTTTNIVETVKTDISSNLERMVKSQNIALTPYEMKNVVNDVFSELDKLAISNKQYQNHLASIWKHAPRNEDGKKTIISEARKFAKDNLPSIMLKVIREATSSTLQKSTESNAKRVEQAKKVEVKTNGGAPSLATSSLSIKDKAAALRAQLKRPLTQDEILAL